MTARNEALHACLRLAERQHGAIGVEQARACGLNARDQRVHVAAGRLRLIEPTVLVVAGSPDTWHRRLQIGLLALGPGAFVSHEAAAALLGLDRSIQWRVEFTTPRASRRSAHKERSSTPLATLVPTT